MSEPITRDQITAALKAHLRQRTLVDVSASGVEQAGKTVITVESINAAADAVLALIHPETEEHRDRNL